MSLENTTVLRRCSKAAFSLSTDGDGYFKRRSIYDSTEEHYLRAIVFPNPKDQKDILPQAAEYQIPRDFQFNDTMVSGLQKKHDKLNQKQQQLCDEVIEIKKQLQQLPLQQKKLDTIAEQLDEINEKFDALNEKIVW